MRSPHFFRLSGRFGLIQLPLLFILQTTFAGSATWNLNPTSGDWNTAANWTPNTVPNGLDDVATFGVSNQTGVSISSVVTEVNEVIFNPGASAFTVTDSWYLTISGIGITNNSGIAQNFVVTGPSRVIYLTNNATAGENTFFTLTGGNGSDSHGGYIFFRGTASADNGTFVVYGSESRNASGAELDFQDNSSAGNGSFTVKSASVRSGEGGNILFDGNSTAANATFVVEGAIAFPFFGGSVTFDLNSTATAGNGVFLINGSSISGAFGGFVYFFGGTAGNATLIANPGTNGGGGGTISFEGGDGGEARIELFGNGTLRMTFSDSMVTVGSIEGDGLLLLGSHKLITGSNDLSTTFSGTIQDTGSLEKIGDGTLSLSSENTYTGGTTVDAGTLVVANTTGSATGTGAVNVSAGILGGGGIIAGPVAVGTGSGAGGFLAPAAASSVQATLTIQSALTFNADATYTYTFRAKRNRARTDMVVANGIAINSGAALALSGHTRGALRQGLVLTLISNISANPISGSFSNLPDGGIVTINGNNLQASYSGGDGNDLTLTVVP
jgi:autotransporter-associated beta strand protein